MAEEDVKHAVVAAVMDVVMEVEAVVVAVDPVDAMTVAAMEPQDGGDLDALAFYVCCR